jgi:hypothetical protein
MPKEEPNGLIPVKYEYCDVTYDVDNRTYLAIAKIGSKKIAFQQVKE